MADGKKSFVLYADLLELIAKLNKNQRGDLLTQILEYVNDLNPSDPKDQMVDLVFTIVRQQLKRDLKKWEDRGDRSRENGKLGGRPPKPDNQGDINNPEEPSGFIDNPEKPKEPDTVNVSVTDTVNVNETKEMFAIFLKAYTGGTKRGLDVEFDYFKKTEKDWQGVCELLLPALNNQIAARKKKNDAGEFVPEWKHLKTWIYQKCWTEEIAVQQSVADHRTVPKPWAYEGREPYEKDCIKRGLKPIPKDLADSIIVSQKGLNEFLDEHKEYAG